ncbi:DUF4126 domain-containing protein [Anaerolineales bacterium HSG6]|nr:DUF4126 domain-containing protein [Anaerolineales bacterium HSG6]
MDALFNVMSAFGLSASAGLNAYLPLLVVAVANRYTDMIVLSKPWDVLSDGRVIAMLVVLLFVEVFVDKIPAIDTANDVIQTIGRPTAGAILFASNSGVVGDVSPVLACIAGLMVAGTVHTAKTVARPMVTASTGGTGNWAVSLIEDVLALIGTILAIVLPVLMGLFVLIFLGLFGFWFIRRRVQVA